MRARIAKFTVLNVAANPHPDGIYHKIFSKAAEAEGRPYGRNWFAKVGKPSPSQDGFFHGRIAIWHELKGKAIETSSLERQDLASLLNDDAEGFGFPSKVFSFTFREADHLLFCEFKNDEGDLITPSSLGKALQKVLVATAADLGIDLSVTVLPEHDTIEQIFELAVVKKISLGFSLPNSGDDLSQEKRILIERLKRQGINKQKSEYTKAKSVETIEIDDELRAEIEVGAENGKVVATGVDTEGHKKIIDTTQRPTIIEKTMAAEDSSVGVLRTLAQEI
ncbi:DUF4747 family protein [Aliiroseovarius sediminis]|uniref:DUF4747 family protein n=1 Tax=Aliiroseovarius sediminis TaxID=2925839 RepID=UPI001F59794A|nr:DUF4747 family protein [Aliiroseovarius sediminis]MCI2395338.1 DUF4747 family protein [Aliiroseovarius sediminis]